jgi:hypothetical protein
MDSSLSLEQQASMAAVMDANPLNYAWGLKDLRMIDGYEYDFTLITGKPQFMRQYHLAQKEQEFASAWVAELEAAGLVKECNSPYAAPTVIAPKKDSDGNWTKLRYAIDYRRLNEDTVKDAYTPPLWQTSCWRGSLSR